MAKILGAIILVLVALKTTNAATSPMCEQISPCLCTFSEYSKIDLSELLPEKDPKKAEEIFLGDADGNVTFYFHGCTDGSWSVKDHGANLNQSVVKASKFILSSPHACIVTHHPGMSTGSILVIIFFVAVAVYLIAGALIAYFIRGARGLELIPNIDFWRGLPGLVRDGIIFLFSGCNPYAINTPDSYDKI